MPPGLVLLAAIQQRAPQAAVDLVDGVGVAVVATALDPQATGGQDHLVLAGVGHLLHQVEHARRAQILGHGGRHPPHRGGQLLAAPASVDRQVELQLRGLVGQARALVGLEEGEQGLDLFAGPRPVERQVGFDRVRGRRDLDAGHPAHAVHLQAQVFEHVDAQHSRHAVGMDLHQLLGPEGGQGGQVDVGDAQGPHVPRRGSALLAGGQVDHRVVVAAADHHRRGLAVGPAHRQPRAAVVERDRHAGRAVGLDHRTRRHLARLPGRGRVPRGRPPGRR